jgi:hypothetical protein
MTLAHVAGTTTPDELLRMPDSNTMELVDGEIVEKNVSAESSETEGIFYFRFQMFLVGKLVAKAYPASLGYQCFPDNPG